MQTANYIIKKDINMKILMISNTFLPVLNGVSTRVNELIKGIQCDVFTMSPHPRANCDKFLYNTKLVDDVYVSSVWQIPVVVSYQTNAAEYNKA